MLYLLHPSDPISLWSPQLLFARPDWLEEDRGDDVVDAMRWIPFVTFWQVTADLPFAGNVPDGHGHVYTTQYVGAWVQVLQPPGWTDDDSERLRDLLAAELTPAAQDSRIAVAAAPTPNELVARWSSAGASRLPLRSRSAGEEDPRRGRADAAEQHRGAGGDRPAGPGRWPPAPRASGGRARPRRARTTPPTAAGGDTRRTQDGEQHAAEGDLLPQDGAHGDPHQRLVREVRAAAAGHPAVEQQRPERGHGEGDARSPRPPGRRRRHPTAARPARDRRARPSSSRDSPAHRAAPSTAAVAVALATTYEAGSRWTTRLFHTASPADSGTASPRSLLRLTARPRTGPSCRAGPWVPVSPPAVRRTRSPGPVRRRRCPRPARPRRPP